MNWKQEPEWDYEVLLKEELLLWNIWVLDEGFGDVGGFGFALEELNVLTEYFVLSLVVSALLLIKKDSGEDGGLIPKYIHLHHSISNLA